MAELHQIERDILAVGMLLTKLKSVLAVTVAVAVTFGLGAGLLTYGTAAGEQNEKKGEAVPRQKEAVAPQLALAASATVRTLAEEGKESSKQPQDSHQAPARKEIGRILLSAELRIMDGEEAKEKRPNRILLIDPESGEWEPVGDADAAHNPRLSPDGKTIAFGNVPERGIWTCDANGRNLKQIFDKGNTAIWNADGKHLIVTKQTPHGTDWKFETWQIDPDGSGATELPLPATDCAIDSSPDGKWITTISGRPQSLPGQRLSNLHHATGRDERAALDAWRGQHRPAFFAGQQEGSLHWLRAR